LRDPAETLLTAFKEGDFEVAYTSALELQKAYHEAMLEISRLNFKLNFGTQVCQRCDGLRAGPGVVATCYQIERCEFKSLKAGEEDAKRSEVIDRLTQQR